MKRAAALAILLVCALPANDAHAADFRARNTIQISAGDTVRDDLYAAAETVTIDGSIDGDLFVAAQTVRVHGRVTGSVFALAETLVVAGAVDGDLRVLARTIQISGAVGGDVLGGAETIDVGSSGRIGRDALLAGARARLDGPIERGLRGLVADLRVNSRVGGDIQLDGVDQLTLGPGARVGGAISYQSRQELNRDPAAEVRGPITRREPETERAGDPWDRVSGILFNIFAVTVLGAAALIISPRGALAAGAAVVQQSILSLAWGFGLLVGIPVAALLLLITIVGIPLALIVILTYGMLLYSSQAIVALGLGHLLLAQLRPVDGYGWSVVSILVGALILTAARSVPFLEAIASLVIFLLGLGGMWLAYAEARASTMSAEELRTAD